MNSVIEGFKNQVWRIVEYDGFKVVSEERIPLDDADEARIVYLLELKAKSHLSTRQVKYSPKLYQVRKDASQGNRVSYSAGDNPYYVASLWRSDELDRV